MRITNKNDLTKCQDCIKFRDCKNLDHSKERCVALEKTDFPYDCPFYTEGQPKIDIEIYEENFANATSIEFMKWLLEQKLNVRVVGYLSNGQKYDLTKTMIKRVISKLEKLEEIEASNNG